MAWVYDPASGEYYDDGQDFTEFQHAGSQVPFLGGPDSAFTLPGDWNKYGMEPYEQADVNQQLTGIKSMMNLWGNPLYALFSDAMGGTSTLDYNQFLNPQMYGGGGGNVGSYQSVYSPGGGAAYQTPYANSIMGSNNADPLLRDYMKRIQDGEDPNTLKLELINSSEGDQNKIDIYSQAIDKAFDEKSNYDIATLQQANVQSPLQKKFAEMGLPDPTMPYTADTLPGDVDMQLTAGLNPFIKEMNADVRANEDIARGAKETAMLDQLLSKGRGRPSGLFNIQDVVQDRARAAIETPSNYSTLTPAQRRAGGGAGGTFLGPVDEPETTGNRYLAPQAKGWDAFPDRQGWLQRGAKQRIEEGKSAARKGKAQERNLQRMDENVRAMAARQLTRQGRTPVKQAMQDRIAMMRSLGIGI